MAAPELSSALLAELCLDDESARELADRLDELRASKQAAGGDAGPAQDGDQGRRPGGAARRRAAELVLRQESLQLCFEAAARATPPSGEPRRAVLVSLWRHAMALADDWRRAQGALAGEHAALAGEHAALAGEHAAVQATLRDLKATVRTLLGEFDALLGQALVAPVDQLQRAAGAGAADAAEAAQRGAPGAQRSGSLNAAGSADAAGEPEPRRGAAAPAEAAGSADAVGTQPATAVPAAEHAAAGLAGEASVAEWAASASATEALAAPEPRREGSAAGAGDCAAAAAEAAPAAPGGDGGEDGGAQAAAGLSADAVCQLGYAAAAHAGQQQDGGPGGRGPAQRRRTLAAGSGRPVGSGRPTAVTAAQAQRRPERLATERAQQAAAPQPAAASQPSPSQSGCSEACSDLVCLGSCTTTGGRGGGAWSAAESPTPPSAPSQGGASTADASPADGAPADGAGAAAQPGEAAGEGRGMAEMMLAGIGPASLARTAGQLATAGHSPVAGRASVSCRSMAALVAAARQGGDAAAPGASAGAGEAGAGGGDASADLPDVGGPGCKADSPSKQTRARTASGGTRSSGDKRALRSSVGAAGTAAGAAVAGGREGGSSSGEAAGEGDGSPPAPVPHQSKRLRASLDHLALAARRAAAAAPGGGEAADGGAAGAPPAAQPCDAAPEGAAGVALRGGGGLRDSTDSRARDTSPLRRRKPGSPLQRKAAPGGEQQPGRSASPEAAPAAAAAEPGAAAADGAPAGAGEVGDEPGGEAGGSVFTLEELLAIVLDVMYTKAEQDAERAAAGLPALLPTGHLQRYVAGKVGGGGAERYGAALNALLDGLDAHRGQPEVAVFCRVLAGEVDEDYWRLHLRLRSHLQQLATLALPQAGGGAQAAAWEGVRGAALGRDALAWLLDVWAEQRLALMMACGPPGSGGGGGGGAAERRALQREWAADIERAAAEDGAPSPAAGCAVAALLLWELRRHAERLAPIAEAFRAADGRRRGALDLPSFRQFCAALNEGMTPDEVAVLFSEELDAAGHGAVGFSAIARVLLPAL
ncbi:hypothetical protein HT031_002083 [Scenedesmus sp. PABB004]|nr:hypothetical protein HT031_002083 [Scenedesmus sp. PABB004]